MKWVRLSSCGIFVAVLAFLATASVPRAAKNPDKPFDGHSPAAKADSQPIGPDEWAKLGNWMKTNACRRRYLFVDRLPEGPLKDHAKQLIIDRFRQIDRMKDPALKAAVIAEVQAQDQIFGVQIDYRHAERKSNQAIGEMRKAVENLIDAEVTEKTLRIARLQADLHSLQEKQKQPEFVDNLIKSYLKRAASPHSIPSPGSLGDRSNSSTESADVAPPK